MDYELKFAHRSGYLHATATGVNSTENFVRFTSEVLEECRRTQLRNVLIEDKLEGPRMSEMDVFLVVIEASKRAAGFYTALAYVDEKIGDARYFAETVAVNRGIPIAIFNNVADAEKWLLSQGISDSEE